MCVMCTALQNPCAEDEPKRWGSRKPGSHSPGVTVLRRETAFRYKLCYAPARPSRCREPAWAQIGFAAIDAVEMAL